MAFSCLVNGFVVALGWPWGGFRVALYSGVYAEYMPSIWLCGGFGWLSAPSWELGELAEVKPLPQQPRVEGLLNGQGATGRRKRKQRSRPE